VPSAYFNQFVNLMVTVLLVPVLLHHLDIADFVIWAIFTTFGGISQQIESAVQIVTVRDIARERHPTQSSSLVAAVGRARQAYLLLALGAILVMLPIGSIYLHYVASDSLDRAYSLEWNLFVLSYAVNYYYGINNSVLLGCGQVATFNNINSLSRLVNLSLTFLLLTLGYSVLGLCASFAGSVLLGCVLNAWAARRALAEQGAQTGPATVAFAEESRSLLLNIARYTPYTLASFLVFRGSVLVGAALFTSEVMGEYSLTLQTCAMLSLLAAVPVQVWLGRLVKAMSAGTTSDVAREARRTMFAANGVYAVAFLGVAIAGNSMLALIGSNISLLTGVPFLLVGLAFYIELNIFLLVAFLVTAKNYRFVTPYVGAVAAGIAMATLTACFTRELVASMIVLPLVIQSAVALPIVFRMFCSQLGMSRSGFLAEIGRALVDRR